MWWGSCCCGQPRKALLDTFCVRLDREVRGGGTLRGVDSVPIELKNISVEYIDISNANGLGCNGAVTVTKKPLFRRCGKDRGRSQSTLARPLRTIIHRYTVRKMNSFYILLLNCLLSSVMGQGLRQPAEKKVKPVSVTVLTEALW